MRRITMNWKWTNNGLAKTDLLKAYIKQTKKKYSFTSITQD